MTAALVLAGLLVGLGGLAWLGQRRFVFFPSGVVPGEPPSDVEATTLTTDDGLDLAAWLVPARHPDARRQPGSRHDPGTAATPRRRLPPGTVVVVLPGNGGNRVGRLGLGRRLAAAGATVLLVDYRGYGGNPGRPSAAGLARDARAALAWVDQRRDLDAGRLVLYGESLGAAVAVEVATTRTPAALVLRSPFSSLADVARHHYRLVPRWLLRDHWPTVDRLAEVVVPTLVVAGALDRIVPLDQSRRVHEAAAGPSEFVVLEGDHNDRTLLDGGLVAAVTEFLAAYLGDGPTG